MIQLHARTPNSHLTCVGALLSGHHKNPSPFSSAGVHTGDDLLPDSRLQLSKVGRPMRFMCEDEDDDDDDGDGDEDEDDNAATKARS
eukprot:671863-Rhodomonas_salina.3